MRRRLLFAFVIALFVVGVSASSAGAFPLDEDPFLDEEMVSHDYVHGQIHELERILDQHGTYSFFRQTMPDFPMYHWAYSSCSDQGSYEHCYFAGWEYICVCQCEYHEGEPFNCRLYPAFPCG